MILMHPHHPPLQLKLTPSYLELVRYQSVTANTKLYFGPSIPNLFLRDHDGIPIPVDKGVGSKGEQSK